MLSFSINFLLTIFVTVSVLIVFIVLMQRPKSEGLGAAFGGGMTENLFGAQTTNVLANFTRWLGGIFFTVALLLSVLYARQSTQRSAIQAAALRAATPAASVPASPAASVIPANPPGNGALGPAPAVKPLASPAKLSPSGRVEGSPAPAAISLIPRLSGSAGQ